MSDSASVSLAFSATLPVKPSITITSTLPAEEVVALDVADEVEARVLEDLVHLLGQLVPLRLFLAHAHEPDARVLDVEERARVDGAHHRELLQVARLAVGVRAHVEQHRAARRVRHHRGQRGPVDLLERAERQLRDRPAGGGVAGREERVRRAVAHLLDGHVDRRALLERRAADRLGHVDRVGRVHHLDGARRAPGCFASSARTSRFRARQQDPQAELARRRPRRPPPPHPRRGRRPWRRRRRGPRGGEAAQTSSTSTTGLPL